MSLCMCLCAVPLSSVSNERSENANALRSDSDLCDNASDRLGKHEQFSRHDVTIVFHAFLPIHSENYVYSAGGKGPTQCSTWQN
jgi:hypothetical protein